MEAELSTTKESVDSLAAEKNELLGELQSAAFAAAAEQTRLQEAHIAVCLSLCSFHGQNGICSWSQDGHLEGSTNAVLNGCSEGRSKGHVRRSRLFTRSPLVSGITQQSVWCQLARSSHAFGVGKCAQFEWVWVSSMV